MAETQDPKELARFNVRGVKPDLAEAKRWYQRALELKASEAEARLRRLQEQ
jgi:TPR repeat protein